MTREREGAPPALVTGEGAARRQAAERGRKAPPPRGGGRAGRRRGAGRGGRANPAGRTEGARARDRAPLTLPRASGQPAPRPPLPPAAHRLRQRQRLPGYLTSHPEEAAIGQAESSSLLAPPPSAGLAAGAAGPVSVALSEEVAPGSARLQPSFLGHVLAAAAGTGVMGRPRLAPHLRLLLLLALLAPRARAWDSGDLELFDLVEEVPRNFYDFLGVQQVSEGPAPPLPAARRRP